MADSLMECYNPLYDVHLKQYFALPHMQKHLRDVGLIENEVQSKAPDNEVYKHHRTMMETLLRNKERVLSQLTDLHKKLDAAEKVEIYRKIKSGLTNNDKEILAHTSRSLSRPAQNKVKKLSKRRQRHHSSSVDDSELIKRVETDFKSDNKFENQNNIYSRLTASVYKYQYLHKLDDRTLQNYKLSLQKQLKKLERFRELTFGLHSVARHQPINMQSSWFFRRRSLPSLTSSSIPPNKLRQPLRSLKPVRKSRSEKLASTPRQFSASEAPTKRQTIRVRASGQHCLPPLPNGILQSNNAKKNGLLKQTPLTTKMNPTIKQKKHVISSKNTSSASSIASKTIKKTALPNIGNTLDSINNQNNFDFPLDTPISLTHKNFKLVQNHGFDLERGYSSTGGSSYAESLSDAGGCATETKPTPEPFLENQVNNNGYINSEIGSTTTLHQLAEQENFNHSIIKRSVEFLDNQIQNNNLTIEQFNSNDSSLQETKELLNFVKQENNEKSNKTVETLNDNSIVYKEEIPVFNKSIENDAKMIYTNENLIETKNNKINGHNLETSKPENLTKNAEMIVDQKYPKQNHNLYNEETTSSFTINHNNDKHDARENDPIYAEDVKFHHSVNVNEISEMNYKEPFEPQNHKVYYNEITPLDEDFSCEHQTHENQISTQVVNISHLKQQLHENCFNTEEDRYNNIEIKNENSEINGHELISENQAPLTIEEKNMDGVNDKHFTKNHKAYHEETIPLQNNSSSAQIEDQITDEHYNGRYEEPVKMLTDSKDLLSKQDLIEKHEIEDTTNKKIDFDYDKIHQNHFHVNKHDIDEYTLELDKNVNHKENNDYDTDENIENEVHEKNKSELINELSKNISPTFNYSENEHNYDIHYETNNENFTEDKTQNNNFDNDEENFKLCASNIQNEIVSVVDKNYNITKSNFDKLINELKEKEKEKEKDELHDKQFHETGKDFDEIVKKVNQDLINSNDEKQIEELNNKKLTFEDLNSEAYNNISLQYVADEIIGFENQKTFNHNENEQNVLCYKEIEQSNDTKNSIKDLENYKNQYLSTNSNKNVDFFDNDNIETQKIKDSNGSKDFNLNCENKQLETINGFLFDSQTCDSLFVKHNNSNNEDHYGILEANETHDKMFSDVNNCLNDDTDNKDVNSVIDYRTVEEFDNTTNNESANKTNFSTEDIKNNIIYNNCEIEKKLEETKIVPLEQVKSSREEHNLSLIKQSLKTEDSTALPESQKQHMFDENVTNNSTSYLLSQPSIEITPASEYNDSCENLLEISELSSPTNSQFFENDHNVRQNKQFEETFDQIYKNKANVLPTYDDNYKIGNTIINHANLIYDDVSDEINEKSSLISDDVIQNIKVNSLTNNIFNYNNGNERDIDKYDIMPGNVESSENEDEDEDEDDGSVIIYNQKAALDSNDFGNENQSHHV